MNTKSGKALSDVYMMAWEKGLKTTYYLRTLAASQVTKATVGDMVDSAPSTDAVSDNTPVAAYASVTSEEVECEACQ